MAALCPSCRSLLPPAPGGAAVACPRCLHAADVGTRVAGNSATADPSPAPTVTFPRKESPADAPFLAPPQQHDEIGRLGPYRVLARIGAGGMGVVFRAEDTALHRHVALKVMLPEFAADPKWKARFLREARAQAKVEHENVVQVYDVGECGGTTYLTMPLLKGQSLGAALKQNRLPPLKEALRVARETAKGLAAAHEVGLIHRDIKPGNIWLEGNKRRVKILDFGLARAADPAAPRVSPDDITLTVQGAVVGTPAFMSPEQAKGEPVDHRTDLYSLGVMLYQMTAGRLPYRGGSALELLIAAETERLDPPNAVNPNVPPAVADLVMRLLARHPAARPPTADAVVDELLKLEDLVGASVNLLGPPPAPLPNDPWRDLDDSTTTASVVRGRAAEVPPPKPWLIPVAAAVAAVALVGAGAFALWPASAPPTAPPVQPPSEPVARALPPVVPKDKEPPKQKEVPPKPDAPALPELADLKPLVRFDYSAGVPPNAPAPINDPNAKYTRWLTGKSIAFGTSSGLWWFQAGPSPQNAAIELRGRVVSPTGMWAFNPIGYQSPLRENGRAGVAITVDHAGVLSISEHASGRPPGEFPTRSYSPKSIKSGREWNTVLVVIRNDRMDVYANGEKVDEGIPLWPIAERAVSYGVRTARGGPAEVEYERVTIWELPATK